MNKKILICVTCFIIILVVIVIYLNKSKKKFVKKNIKEEIIIPSEIIEDKETGEYVIYDERTGKEIMRSPDEASLVVYKTNPDYDPILPAIEEKNE